MFMKKRHEKAIYENDRGERVEIGYSFPYLGQQIIGVDGTNTEISTSKGVGQDGVDIHEVTLTERPIQIIGTIRGKSKDELQNYRAELLRVFNPKVKGTLEYEYGDVKRQIRVQVDSAPVFSKAFQTFEVLNFIINLVAPNPYWLDNVVVSEEIVTWIGGMTFPLTFPTRFSMAGPKTINIFNHGDVETPVRLEISGTATNPKVLKRDTGEYIKINRTLLVGDLLVITTEFGNKRVEKNDINVFNYIDLSSKFFSLDVGDNVIELITDDVNDNANIKVIYFNRYLGV